MASHTAERALFSDLTRLLLSMRDAPYCEVEACIEDRFRNFLRHQAAKEEVVEEVGALQITFTWTLPDGADDWAVYATEYKTLPAMPPELPKRVAAAGADASVIAFPAPPGRRSTATSGASARIIAFPG